jgi:hypothetical protein
LVSGSKGIEAEGCELVFAALFAFRGCRVGTRRADSRRQRLFRRDGLEGFPAFVEDRAVLIGGLMDAEIYAAVDELIAIKLGGLDLDDQVHEAISVDVFFADEVLLLLGLEGGV